MAQCYSEEVTQKQLNKIRQVVNHERLDEELYQDHETEEAKKVAGQELLQRHFYSGLSAQPLSHAETGGERK